MALLGLTISVSYAQQNQNVPNSDAEVEKLRIQLQTVENEKMAIETKLAEANTKLINADIDRLKGELRESNNDWLKSWSGWFLTIIGIFAAILLGVSYVFWYWLRTRTDKLIATEVEKRINRFQEAFDQVSKVKDELAVLEKEHAVTVLDNSDIGYPVELEWHTESIKALSEEMLLNIFNDPTRDLGIRWAAADVLVIRKSERLVKPMLTFLNSIVISKVDPDIYQARFCDPIPYWDLISGFCNEETYQGVREFHNILTKEESENKDLFLRWTVFLLAQISLKLDTNDSIELLREVIPDMKDLEQSEIEVIALAKYFDKFQEYEAIKEILTNGLTKGIPNADTKCLELLPIQHLNFVKEWEKKRESTNSESENPE